MSDVLAIAFNVFAEKARERVTTQVIIVKRASSLEFSAWISWIRIVFGLLPTFLLFSMVFGPLSTAIATAALLHYSIAIAEAIQARFNVPREDIVYWYNVVAVSGIFIFVLVWTAILISSAVTLMVSLALIGGMYLLFSHSPSTFLQWRLHDYPTPKLTYPIEVYYDQSEIKYMLSFRDKVFQHHRDKVALVSTGSYLVEAFCSMIMPSPLYNSPRMRRMLHYFLGYLMPLIFALKFVWFIYPLIQHSWLGYFWKDTIIGAVGMLISFLVSFLQWILTRIYNILGGDSGPLSILFYLENTMTFIAATAKTSIGYALFLDERLVYIRTKMRDFASLLSPLTNMIAKTFQAGVSGPTRFFIDMVTRTTNANASLARAWDNKRKLQKLITPSTPTSSRLDESFSSEIGSPHESLPIPRQPSDGFKPSRLQVMQSASLPSGDLQSQHSLPSDAQTSSLPEAYTSLLSKHSPPPEAHSSLQSQNSPPPEAHSSLQPQHSLPPETHASQRSHHSPPPPEAHTSRQLEHPETNISHYSSPPDAQNEVDGSGFIEVPIMKK